MWHDPVVVYFTDALKTHKVATHCSFSQFSEKLAYWNYRYRLIALIFKHLSDIVSYEKQHSKAAFTSKRRLHALNVNRQNFTEH